MSVSKTALQDKELIRKVLHLYLKDERKLYVQEIAQETGSTGHNVLGILHANVSKERYIAERSLRWSKKQLGSKGNMWGRTGDKHPNWKGDCSDQKGHLTRKVDGKRQFVHRLVMLEVLGLKQLPRGWHVHHINGDGEDNRLDNLVLCTIAGHRAPHKKWLQLRGNPLWERYQSSISKSKKMPHS